MSQPTEGAPVAGAPTAELTATLVPVRGADVEVTDLHRLTGGASRETWAFTARSASHGVEELILRRDPPGRPGAPGSMALEADAMRAASGAGLPAPTVVVDDDGTTLGTAGLVMARVPGETLARRILRDDAYATARTVLAGQCGRFLAGLHAIDPAQVRGIEARDPLAAARLRYDDLGEPSPTFEIALRWLEANRPPSNGQVIVHGDLRLGNIIVDPDGLAAAIDWELVHLGDPLEDLGWLCTKAWRFRSPLPVGGFGTLDQLFEAYESAGGVAVDPEAFRWWLVLNTLKWGLGCMGQAAVHLRGDVRSVELAAIGRRTGEQEWDLLELLFPAATDAALADAPQDDAGAAEPGVHGRPTARELLEAVGGFLVDEVMPATPPAVSFHTRVAANVVAVVQRELALGPTHEARWAEGLRSFGAGGSAELAQAIAKGRLDGDDRLHRFLAASVRDKLAVANPRHLEQSR